MQQKKIRFNLSFNMIAILSICIYVISSVVFETVTILPSYYSSISLYGCLACCIINCFGKGKIKYNWFILMLIFLGLVISFSYLYAPDKGLTQVSLYRYWTSIILLVCIYTTIEDTNDVELLINSFIYSGAILAVFVYLYYGHEYLITMDERLSSEEFGNMNELGITCALSVVLAVYKLIKTKKNIIIYCLVIAICMFIILITASRKALLSVAISLIVFILLNSKKKYTLYGVLVSIIIIWLIQYVINNVEAFNVVKERFGAFGEKNESDANRIMYIQEGLKAFKNNFLWGNGFGYSYHLFGTYSHNNYVELLMCHGLLGFCSYYYLYYRLARETGKIKSNRIEMALLYALLVRLLFLEIGLVDYYSRRTLLLLLVMCSLIECKYKECKYA